MHNEDMERLNAKISVLMVPMLKDMTRKLEAIIRWQIIMSGIFTITVLTFAVMLAVFHG